MRSLAFLAAAAGLGLLVVTRKSDAKSLPPELGPSEEPADEIPDSPDIPSPIIPPEAIEFPDDSGGLSTENPQPSGPNEPPAGGDVGPAPSDEPDPLHLSELPPDFEIPNYTGQETIRFVGSTLVGPKGDKRRTKKWQFQNSLNGMDVYLFVLDIDPKQWLSFFVTPKGHRIEHKISEPGLFTDWLFENLIVKPTA